MSKTIKTSILIHASKEKVWAILSDFENYNQWNPFILSIQGEVKIGHKISVQVMAPGSKLMSFEPRILSFERNKEWIWEGILFSKILFRGEHQFQLVDHGDGTTTFHHNEIFKDF